MVKDLEECTNKITLLTNELQKKEEAIIKNKSYEEFAKKTLEKLISQVEGLNTSISKSNKENAGLKAELAKYKK